MRSLTNAIHGIFGRLAPAMPVSLDAALIALALTDALLGLYSAEPWQTALSVAAAGGLVFRRRLPLVSFVIAMPGLFTGSALLAVMIALCSLAASSRSRMPLVILCGVTALSGYLVVNELTGDPQDIVLGGIYGLLFVAGPIALGALLATRRDLSQRLRDLSIAQAEERRLAAAQALAHERAQLAREMHDTVSHQISLIAVQAGALQVQRESPQASATGREIRELCAMTLQELRAMVAVLRRAGSQGQLEPQPGIADIPDLLARSGLTITSTIDVPDGLPSNVQRTVYRTIQEGLTNARKHAPGSAVTVDARCIARTLHVRIHTSPAQQSRRTATANRSGFGITGLRERAELLGGRLDIDDGPAGFTVELTAPLAERDS